MYFEGDSGRYSRRGNDKEHRRRLKGGERIFKAYQADPDAVLEVVNIDHMLFHVTSETSPTIKYSVSLSTYYCDCPSRVSTCKHILGVQFIVKEFFSPSHSEEVQVVEMDYVQHGNDEVLSPLEVDGVDVHCTTDMEGRKRHVQELEGLLHEAEGMISQVRSSLQDYTLEEVEQKKEILQRFMTSLSEPFTFVKPTTIDLPRRGSIAIIQENVKRTRMGHGQKRKAIGGEECSIPQPPLKRPPHLLVAHSKQKRTMFPKVSKAYCDICKVNTRIEQGDEYVACKNCDSPLNFK